MGYDMAIFPSPEEIPDQFLCSICQDVLEDPVESECKHVFCRDCIRTWLRNEQTCPMDRNALRLDQLRSPSFNFVSLITSLLVMCPYSSNGCDLFVTLDERQSHSRRCKFNPKVESICEVCHARLNGSTIKSHDCVEHYRKGLVQVEDSNRVEAICAIVGAAAVVIIFGLARLLLRF